MEQFVPTWVSPDAERAYGTVLRHAERTCCRWIPGALKCFKGAGEPHRTPALMAGIDAVPYASASRRPPGSLLAWNNFLRVWVSLTPSRHAVRASGTCPGRSSGTCPGRSSGTCPGRSSGTCPGRSSGTCPGRSSGTCPGRSSGTLSGNSLFNSTVYSTHRPRNQLRGVATCRSGASARAAPDRWRP